jgi:hypothetical protein
VSQAFPSKEFVRVGPVHEPYSPPTLELQVIFTSAAGTRAALAAASQYARGLGARITILAAQVVPYPLPLDCPPVPVEFTERTLRSLASEQNVASEVELAVELYLCRDKNETIRKVLKPDSLVVIGGWKRWWPAAENRLEKLLRRDGHRVILANEIFA